MKRTAIVRACSLFLCLSLLFAANVNSQSLYEDFNYTAGQNIGGTAGSATGSANNWSTHSASNTGTIDVTAGSLSYTGLMASAGNKVRLPGSNATTTRDVNRAITGSGSNIAYYSVLINVADATQLSGTTPDYFMHFGATTGNSVPSQAGRLSIKSVNTNANYRLSIKNISGTGESFTEFAQDLNFGNTYLVVVKLDKSTSPITASLWVNPASLGGAEPGGSVTNTGSASAFASFASICLRNAGTTPKVDIDEIRVGTTWASVTPTAGGLTPPTLNPAVGATVDNPFNVTFTDDPAWTAAITQITVNNTALTAGSSVSPGTITFTPSASVPANLLQTAGALSIAVIATGYTDATVSQGLGVGASAKLAMVVQPPNLTSNGGMFTPAPQVRVQDQYNNNVLLSTAAITATAFPPPTWTAGGGTTENAVNGTGIATFSTLTGSSVGSVIGAIIQFTSSGLASVNSNPFNIPGPPADHLVITANPSTGITGKELTTITVEARDPSNSVDIAYSGNITIAVATGPGSISGTVTKAAFNGVANFSDLKLSMAGTYTLSATSGSLPVVTTGNIVVIDPLAFWTFEGVTISNTGTAPVISGGSSVADIGLQTVGSQFSALHASAGTSWSMNAGNGSVKAVSCNNWAVGDYYQFKVSTTNYSSIKVQFDQTGSNTGPRDFKLQYSTDGTNFTDFASYQVPNNAGNSIGWNTSGSTAHVSTVSFDLSAVTAIENLLDVYLRVTDNSTFSINGGTVGATGTNRIDNFIVLGTSAPLSSPPALTAAPGATVDNPFNVTFTDDLAWRTAITSIRINNTILTSGFTVSAGQITFTPSASVPAALLQVSGTKNIVITATGYFNNAVTQPLGFGVETKLALSVQPTAPPTNGAQLAVQPKVLVEDQYGNNNTSSTASVLASVGAGTWTIGGTTTQISASGLATYTDLTATSAAAVTGATIVFSSGSLTPVTSDPFDIPGVPADHIVFTAVPVSGISGYNLYTVVVEARRPDNTLDNLFNGNVTVSKASGPGTLGGSLTKNASSGIATFSNLTFDMAGTYTLFADHTGFAQITSSSISLSDPIARWSFDGVTTTNTGTSPTVSVGSDVADGGTQTSGSQFAALHASAATVWANPTGNGSTKALSSNTWAVGDYYQFKVNTTGYINIKLKYDQTGSGTGPKDFTLQYSTDGTNYTDFTMYSVANNGGAGFSWSATSGQQQSMLDFDLSSVTAINNAATVYFRLANNSTASIGNGTVAAGGTNRVDNFIVLGTFCNNPSPGSVTGTTPLCVGQSTTYTSSGDPGGVWSSTVPTVASVNPSTGVVTALTVGSTDITYTVSPACTAPVSAFQTLNVVACGVTNDDATGAIPLTFGPTCSGSPFTNAGATQGGLEPYPSCQGTAGYHTVWYSFTAPASGNVKISTDHAGGSLGADTRISLFSTTNPADYSMFTNMACSDDNGSTVPGRSVLYMTGLTGGGTYYIQVDGKDNSTTMGTFCISIEDVSSPMISTATACAAGQSLVNVNDNYTGWMSLVDANSNLIAMIKNPAGGATTSTYAPFINVNTGAVRNDGMGRSYLDRNITINNAAVANVNVRFFLLNTELTALQAADPSVTLANLQVTRQTGVICNNDFNAANGVESSIAQTGNGSGTGFSWFNFTTPAFSKFYAHTKKGYMPVKVWLQGAYRITPTLRHRDNNAAWTTIMNTNALNQPYNIAPFTYTGTESVPAGFFATNAATTDPIDWVLLELRNSATPATVMATRAAIIREDGKVVDLDGVSDPAFRPIHNNVADGNYFVVVRHRNHLAIRSNITRALAGYLGGPTDPHDFTTAQASAYQDGGVPQNTAMKDLTGGAFGMYAGNGNANTTVRANGGASTATNDYQYLITLALGGSVTALVPNVYHRADFNMDGNIRANGGASTAVNDYQMLITGALAGSVIIIVTNHL